MFNKNFILFFILLNVSISLSMMTGGICTTTYESLSPPEKELIDYTLKEGINMYNQMVNSIYKYGVVEQDNDRIMKQIVEGVKYTVKVKLTPTICQNGGENSVAQETCELGGMQEFSIQYRPWMPKMEDQRIVTIHAPIEVPTTEC